MRFRVAREPWSDYYGVLIELTPGSGARFVAAPQEWNAVMVDEGSMTSPTFSLQPDAAKSLLDALLAAGVKPSTEPETKQELGAVQKHLADMRSIVSQTLKVKL